MKPEISEKAKTFDPDDSMKCTVNEALVKLGEFRKEYPFAEDPTQIDRLTADDIISDKGEMGDFFRYIEHQLIALGHLTLYGSKVYHNIRGQLEDFKELLHITVDKKKTLAEKVDAPWQEISGLGRDSHIAKKIIFCFNYESNQVVPIFKTSDLEYFLETLLGKMSFPIQYENMSKGEKYQFLTEELLNAKESSGITKPWEITYFCRFLYATYPPPENIDESERKALLAKAIREQQNIKGDFMDLLNQLRRQNKISAEQLRDYRDAGFKNPEAMQTLTEKLSKLK